MEMKISLFISKWHHGVQFEFLMNERSKKQKAINFFIKIAWCTSKKSVEQFHASKQFICDVIIWLQYFGYQGRTPG